jgi:hypothetical protein
LREGLSDTDKTGRNKNKFPANQGLRPFECNESTNNPERTNPMKKILYTLFAGIMMIPATVLAQKTDQSELLNEVFAGYGAATIYYFTQPVHHDYDNNNGIYPDFTGDPSSIGTFFVGYNRAITQVFNMGIVFSYMQFQTSVSGHSYDIIYSGTSYDNLMSMIARLKFAYVNKGAIQVYSGVAIGITVDVNRTTLDGGQELTDKNLRPAGEIILMGIRGGRKLGGFLEFGFGTNGIVTGGVSYKFGKE